MTFYQKVRVFFPLATKVTITRCSWMEKLGRFLDMIDVLVICSRQLTFSNVVECGRFFRHWNFSGISLYLYIDVLCILLLKIRCMYVLYVLCPCVSRYQLDKYTHTNTQSERERKIRTWISLYTRYFGWKPSASTHWLDIYVWNWMTTYPEY